MLGGIATLLIANLSKISFVSYIAISVAEGIVDVRDKKKNNKRSWTA